MILIFTESQDTSALKVYEILISRKIETILIDDLNKIKFSFLTLDNKNEQVSFIVLDNIINLKDVKSVWFRRGFFSSFTDYDLSLFPPEVYPDLKSNIDSESNSLKYYIYDLFKKNTLCISDPRFYQVNKLKSLRVARDCGLFIPRTIIATTKQQVEKYFKKTTIITKGIQEIFSLNFEKMTLFNQTEIILTESLPKTFFPSLFQENLMKTFEIRTFFFHSKLYSMGIFSQDDPMTKVDFRNYNYQKPNRTLPIILPDDITLKIKKFMDRMNLESGSIDIIYQEPNKYIFLEVNPVGQYEFLEVFCNYNISQDIANILAYGR